MGIFDTVTSMMEQPGSAGDQANAGDQTKVAAGLIKEMQQRPGGIGGLLQSFQQNGMGSMVQQWAGGQTQAAAPGQVEQGLGGTGIVESIAQRTGISPAVVSAGLAEIVPLLVHHAVSNGHVTAEGQPTGAPEPEPGGLLQSLLSKLL